MFPLFTYKRYKILFFSVFQVKSDILSCGSRLASFLVVGRCPVCKSSSDSYKGTHLQQEAWAHFKAC